MTLRIGLSMPQLVEVAGLTGDAMTARFAVDMAAIRKQLLEVSA